MLLSRGFKGDSGTYGDLHPLQVLVRKDSYRGFGDFFLKHRHYRRVYRRSIGGKVSEIIEMAKYDTGFIKGVGVGCGVGWGSSEACPSSYSYII